MSFFKADPTNPDDKHLNVVKFRKRSIELSYRHVHALRTRCNHKRVLTRLTGLLTEKWAIAGLGLGHDRTSSRRLFLDKRALLSIVLVANPSYNGHLRWLRRRLANGRVKKKLKIKKPAPIIVVGRTSRLVDRYRRRRKPRLYSFTRQSNYRARQVQKRYDLSIMMSRHAFTGRFPSVQPSDFTFREPLNDTITMFIHGIGNKKKIRRVFYDPFASLTIHVIDLKCNKLLFFN